MYKELTNSKIINKKNKKSFAHNVWENRFYLFMLLPTLIFLFLFNVVPLFGLQLAFKRFDFAAGIWGSQWIGWKNFELFFKTKTMMNMVSCSVIYSLVMVAVGQLTSIFLAIVFDAMGRRKVNAYSKLTQTLSIFPNFISWVVIGYFITAFLDIDRGILNRFFINMGKAKVMWYNETSFWPYFLVFINTWKSGAYGAVVYYAFVRSISDEYYEAAWIDGANWFQTTYYVTLPFLRQLLTIGIILAMGGILNSDIGLFYIITRDSSALYNVTTTLDTYIYRNVLNGSEYGFTTAVSLLKMVVGFGLVQIVNKVSKAINDGNGIY